MKNFYLGAFAVGICLLTPSAPALAQDPHHLLIDDTGKVVTEHQQHRAKKGDKISWARQSDSTKPWYVKFTGASPCAEGKQFGSGRSGVCTVKAVCNKAGDAGCKSYHYQSATARGAQLNDPEIIIEP
jgi:hypothetical protein